MWKLYINLFLNIPFMNWMILLLDYLIYSIIITYSFYFPTLPPLLFKLEKNESYFLICGLNKVINEDQIKWDYVWRYF